jgi:hypothetical protein
MPVGKETGEGSLFLDWRRGLHFDSAESETAAEDGALPGMNWEKNWAKN